eukprot:gene6270-7812_t
MKYKEFRISTANMYRHKKPLLPDMFELPPIPTPICNNSSSKKIKTTTTTTTSIVNSSKKQIKPSSFKFPPSPHPVLYSDLQYLKFKKEKEEQDRLQQGDKKNKKRKHKDGGGGGYSKSSKSHSKYSDGEEEGEKVVTMPVGTPIPLNALSKKKGGSSSNTSGSTSSSISSTSSSSTSGGASSSSSGGNSLGGNTTNNNNNNNNNMETTPTTTTTTTTTTQHGDFFQLDSKLLEALIPLEKESISEKSIADIATSNSKKPLNDQKILNDLQAIRNDPNIIDQVRQLYENQRFKESQLMAQRQELINNHNERKKIHFNKYCQDLLYSGNNTVVTKQLKEQLSMEVQYILEQNQEELKQFSLLIINEMNAIRSFQQMVLQNLGVIGFFQTQNTTHIEQQMKILECLFPSENGKRSLILSTTTNTTTSPSSYRYYSSADAAAVKAAADAKRAKLQEDLKKMEERDRIRFETLQKEKESKPLTELDIRKAERGEMAEEITEANNLLDAAILDEDQNKMIPQLVRTRYYLMWREDPEFYTIERLSKILGLTPMRVYACLRFAQIEYEMGLEGRNDDVIPAREAATWVSDLMSYGFRLGGDDDIQEENTKENEQIRYDNGISPRDMDILRGVATKKKKLGKPDPIHELPTQIPPNYPEKPIYFRGPTYVVPRKKNIIFVDTSRDPFTKKLKPDPLVLIHGIDGSLRTPSSEEKTEILHKVYPSTAPRRTSETLSKRKWKHLGGTLPPLYFPPPQRP